jgi:hypothetical protein
MLDVQAQQAFAPQAVTYFTPTEVPEGQTPEALAMSGYSDAEARNTYQELLGSSSMGDFPGVVQQAIRDLLTQYHKDFIQNVTSSEERVQVASLSWSAEYAVTTGFGSIDFEPFVACAKRYQDEVRNKGLELLPDGTFNLAAARSIEDGKDESSDTSTSGSTRVSGLTTGHVVMALVAAGISLL